MSLEQAYEILERSIIRFNGEPIGTAAACDPAPVAANYEECFVRDFVSAALVFLLNGRPEIVRRFLETVMNLRGRQRVQRGHRGASGLMPASFRVNATGDGIDADFGDRAIGRVVPVDSAMWWTFLLRAYVVSTGDWDYAHQSDVQTCLREVLELYLIEQFETAPTLLVPDGAFMVDRRMAVYGYPLEIQALFYGMLLTARELLLCTGAERAILDVLDLRIRELRDYVLRYYWIDRARLNEIHRFKGEEFGPDASNVLNVYPESIPDWMDGWLDGEAGYLVGNQGPGRVDFRFFSQGNLLAILFGVAKARESEAIMHLFEHRWDRLIGDMPLKIVYPAVAGKEWMHLTGSDPKNVPWSYHNGGNWPVLIWPFVGAALRTGREEMAQRALDALERRLATDDWPEYYDGKGGDLIGRRANFFQTWSATGYILSHEILHQSDRRAMFNLFAFTDTAAGL